jgi:hypothetical protein
MIVSKDRVHGISRDFMEFHGISWDFKGFHGNSWDFMGYDKSNEVANIQKQTTSQDSGTMLFIFKIFFIFFFVLLTVQVQKGRSQIPAVHSPMYSRQRMRPASTAMAQSYKTILL